jgi:mercuric ion transport protein
MVESTPPLPGTNVEANHARHRRIGTSIGAIVAASLASLCCIGPVLFVTVGIGAGLARQFEPLRPLFTIITIALMAAGFYSVYGRAAGQDAESCDDDAACRARSASRTRDKVVLWGATLIALVLLTLPRWSLWLL